MCKCLCAQRIEHTHTAHTRARTQHSKQNTAQHNMMHAYLYIKRIPSVHNNGATTELYLSDGCCCAAVTNHERRTVYTDMSSTVCMCCSACVVGLRLNVGRVFVGVRLAVVARVVAVDAGVLVVCVFIGVPVAVVGGCGVLCVLCDWLSERVFLSSEALSTSASVARSSLVVHCTML